MSEDKLEEDVVEEGNIAEKFTIFANALDNFIKASDENLADLNALALKYPRILGANLN